MTWQPHKSRFCGVAGETGKAFVVEDVAHSSRVVAFMEEVLAAVATE